MITNKTYNEMTADELHESIFTLAKHESFIKIVADSLLNNELGITNKVWESAKVSFLVSAAIKFIESNNHIGFIK